MFCRLSTVRFVDTSDWNLSVYARDFHENTGSGGWGPSEMTPGNYSNWFLYYRTMAVVPASHGLRLYLEISFNFV
jgi:hypothetical protein